MRYLLLTGTSYEHLAKKFERAILTHVGGTAQKWQFVSEVFCSLAPFNKREWPLRAR